jgi:hypothetical protein
MAGSPSLSGISTTPPASCHASSSSSEPRSHCALQRRSADSGIPRSSRCARSPCVASGRARPFTDGTQVTSLPAYGPPLGRPHRPRRIGVRKAPHEVGDVVQRSGSSRPSSSAASRRRRPLASPIQSLKPRTRHYGCETSTAHLRLQLALHVVPDYVLVVADFAGAELPVAIPVVLIAHDHVAVLHPHVNVVRRDHLEVARAVHVVTAAALLAVALVALLAVALVALLAVALVALLVAPLPLPLLPC